MISGIAKKETSTEIKFRVGDERLLKVSESASVKVKSLLQRQGRSEGVLRVAVIGGGCSGLQYKLDLQDAPANRDILVESGGIRVVVDPKTAILIDDLIKEITLEYNITTVVNTHDMNSVMQIGDNIAFINKGEIWWKGNNEELIISKNKELNNFVFASKLFKRLKQ